MNTINNHIIIQDKAAVSGSQNLRNGGFVFIKTIKSDGPNSYIISLGNKFFKAYSDKPLALNSYLKVQVSLDGSKINLIPEKNINTLQSKTLHELNIDMLKEGLFSEQIMERFNQLGLPLDLASFRMISFFQQMGLKADNFLLMKCRRVASKFPGHEEDAAEIAIFLAEKGINPTEENIALFLNVLLYASNDFDSAQDSEQNHKDIKFSKKNDFSLFDDLYNVKLSELSNTGGLLTLSNHISLNNKHWIIMPFIFSNKLFQKDFHGNIRILIDVERKSTEKIVIYAENSQNIYNFTLYYNKGDIIQILFYIDSIKKDISIENITVELQKMFPKTEVKFDNQYEKKGLFCDMTWNFKAVRMDI